MNPRPGRTSKAHKRRVWDTQRSEALVFIMIEISYDLKSDKKKGIN